MSGQRLLPDGVEVAFSELDRTLTAAFDARCRRGASPALTATVVAIGPGARLRDAATALESLARAVGIRPILISDGDSTAPPVLVSEHAIALEGLRPSYVNNAVAALRLSSLPTIVWWRGGSEEALDALSELCDRLVLDAEDPLPSWSRAAPLLERTAVSDLRWTRLTRWRALMGHFFDIPEVRAAAPSFTKLAIEASDSYAARLYAAWLLGVLRLESRVSVEFGDAPGDAPIRSVRLGNGTGELRLRLAANGTCVETRASVVGHTAATRMVALGAQDLPALLAEELRVRSRDLAFERALHVVQRTS